MDALGGELREQIEVRDDEVASENSESVADGHALRQAGRVEVVGRVGLLAEHHRAGARASEHRAGSVQAEHFVPERCPSEDVDRVLRKAA